MRQREVVRHATGCGVDQGQLEPGGPSHRDVSALLMALRSSCSPTGFKRISVPTRCVTCGPLMNSCRPVIRITGSSGRAALASRSNSKPSIAGIPMSDMTQSTFANASSLRNACAEVNKHTVCPADSNRFSSDSSTRSSSSITATAHSLKRLIQEAEATFYVPFAQERAERRSDKAECRRPIDSMGPSLDRQLQEDALCMRFNSLRSDTQLASDPLIGQPI